MTTLRLNQLNVEQLSLDIFAIVVHVWYRIIAQMLLKNIQKPKQVIIS